MTVIDPNSNWLPVESVCDHQVQIPIAIDVSGTDVKTTAVVAGLHFESGVGLRAKKHLDLIVVDSVYQAP